MKAALISSIHNERTQARLEFIAEVIDDHNVHVRYELVLPLDEVDCRGTWDHKAAKTPPKHHRMIYLTKANDLRIPLGGTMIGTGGARAYPRIRDDGHIDLPFRDGAHCSWDHDKLNLPIYMRGRGLPYGGSPVRVCLSPTFPKPPPIPLERCSRHHEEPHQDQGPARQYEHAQRSLPLSRGREAVLLGLAVEQGGVGPPSDWRLTDTPSLLR